MLAGNAYLRREAQKVKRNFADKTFSDHMAVLRAFQVSMTSPRNKQVFVQSMWHISGVCVLFLGVAKGEERGLREEFL